MGEDEPQSPLPLEYRHPDVEPQKPSWPLWRILLLALLLIFVSLNFLLVDRARPATPAQLAAAHLRGIGFAIFMYASAHRGEYPDTLEALVIDQTVRLAPSDLVRHGSNDTAATGATTQALEASLQQPGHNSYVYLGKGMNIQTVPPNAVIAYEAHSNHGGGGVNVLYGDGHVEWADSIKTSKILVKVAAASRAGGDAVGRDPLPVPSPGPGEGAGGRTNRRERKLSFFTFCANNASIHPWPGPSTSASTPALRIETSTPVLRIEMSTSPLRIGNDQLPLQMRSPVQPAR